MRSNILPCLLMLALSGTVAAGTTRVYMDKGELHYAGDLDDDANRRLFALYDSLATKPAVLAIDSKGGDVATGLDAQAARFDRIVADGWTFSKEGFGHFGVGRIRVLDGPWRPAPAAHGWDITMLEVDALPGSTVMAP